MSDEPKPNGNTRYLNQSSGASQMPPRQTSPLDYVPWVIEFRIVGTASTLQVKVSESMVIGRQDKNQQPLDVDLTPFGALEKGVSRRHAMIMASDNRITIKDLGSANGTYLNDHALTPWQEYKLRHNDRLAFGRLQVQLLFAVVPASAETSAPKPTNQPAPLAVPVIGSGQHILVVEDDPDVANVFGMILRHAGFKVTVTNTVSTAMNAVAGEMPDMVVLDLMLADMSGLELVKYVRSQDSGREIPIIVVSGATGGFQKNQALQAGVDVFLGKPIGIDELIHSVGDVLKRRSRSEEDPTRRIT